jgi:hypothetical protein
VARSVPPRASPTPRRPTAPAAAQGKQYPNFWAAITANPQLKSMANFVTGDMKGALQNPKLAPFTIFAPTDAAFNAMLNANIPGIDIKAAMSNQAILSMVLNIHLASGVSGILERAWGQPCHGAARRGPPRGRSAGDQRRGAAHQIGAAAEELPCWQTAGALCAPRACSVCPTRPLPCQLIGTAWPHQPCPPAPPRPPPRAAQTYPTSKMFNGQVIQSRLGGSAGALTVQKSG